MNMKSKDAKLFVSHHDLIEDAKKLALEVRRYKEDFILPENDMLFRMTYDALIQYNDGLRVFILIQQSKENWLSLDLKPVE